MNNEFNDNFLKDENGNVRGRLFVAFSNIQESDGMQICADDLSLGLLENMVIGTELCCASSNDSSKVISIDGLNIKLEKPMFTANETFLKKGEIIIIKDDKYYKTEDKSLIV